MNIEVLLKLRCQQALAQGDYDSLKLYSDQLSMYKDGTPLVDLPMLAYLKEALAAESAFLTETDRENFYAFEQALEDLYGKDLYQACKSFMLYWNSADFDVAIRE